ncbi:MAG: energy transducer TonB [Geobacteraceae bacterium GWC2_55_20]|nr:MAG: energy transducer TonB [Geobacteraceae bacterium GWC2_55_20]OGU24841.1 MAG: energy transducer TonB [Geobacteraceae bacterium GWF2_54_21]
MKTPYQNWLVPGVVGLVFLLIVGFVVKVFLSDDGVKKKALYQVTLIKPPPPEEKVKPPEPEQQKETPKESIQTPTEIPQPQAQDQPQDNAPPAGADLGVEGEGGAGSDGFGLVGKGKNYKGRDITLGGGGGMNRLAMLTKYGWYTSKIQDEIKKQLKKRMDKEGGVPKGKYEITLKILLDPQGTIKKYRIVASSGNDKLDDALKASLPGLKISQAPPDGMPSLVTLRILSQG